MRRCQYTVTRTSVHAHAVGLVLAHLRLADFSPRCTARRLLTILFAAAARLSSVFDTCQNLLRAPSDETVRQALLATLPSYAELQRRLNRALAGDLPVPAWPPGSGRAAIPGRSFSRRHRDKRPDPPRAAASSRS
jgi:hypothetical protein